MAAWWDGLDCCYRKSAVSAVLWIVFAVVGLFFLMIGLVSTPALNHINELKLFTACEETLLATGTTVSTMMSQARISTLSYTLTSAHSRCDLSDAD